MALRRSRFEVVKILINLQIFIHDKPSGTVQANLQSYRSVSDSMIFLQPLEIQTFHCQKLTEYQRSSKMQSTRQKRNDRCQEFRDDLLF